MPRSSPARSPDTGLQSNNAVATMRSVPLSTPAWCTMAKTADWLGTCDADQSRPYGHRRC